MNWKSLLLIVALVVLPSAVKSNPQGTYQPLLLASQFSPSCNESATFLARTTGLDLTHEVAYDGLICGLVADGVWIKLDALYIFATQDIATASLNLVSTSYTPNISGTPPFVADRGFTGISGNGTNRIIDTNFDPANAVSPQFTQNAGHISLWSVTNTAPTSELAMGSGVGGSQTDIEFNTTALFRVTSTGLTGVSNASNSGHYIANRSDASTVEGYKNGASIFSNGSAPSQAPPIGSYNFFILALNCFPAFGCPFGTGQQIAEASIGSDVSANAANFYNRLRTYMTAVGVP